MNESRKTQHLNDCCEITFICSFGCIFSGNKHFIRVGKFEHKGWKILTPVYHVDIRDISLNTDTDSSGFKLDCILWKWSLPKIIVSSTSDYKLNLWKEIFSPTLYTSGYKAIPTTSSHVDRSLCPLISATYTWTQRCPPFKALFCDMLSPFPLKICYILYDVHYS